MKSIRRRSCRAVLAIGFGWLAAGGLGVPGWSQETPSTGGDLEQRVRILERKLEVAGEEAAAQAKDALTVKADKDGFQLANAEKSFALKVHLLFQADSRFFINDKAHAETDQFLLRRVRPSIEGTLFKHYDFVVVPDFANNASTALYDAYLEAHPFSQAKLRVGKFKPPIGLEHLQSDPYTLFAERSFASNLVPSRDTGLQLSGEWARGALGYALAFTNGIGDNNASGDTDSNDGKEGTARLYTKPFKNSDQSLLQGLHFGLGGSYARQNVAAPAYRSPGQLTLFTAASNAVPDGEKIRLAPELAWYYRTVGLQGEWTQSSQVYRVGAARGRLVNQAWQAAASWVLTGEDASFTGVKPRKPFDPKAGGWGAWQLAARYDQLYLDPDAFTRGVTTPAQSVQRASAYGVGVNWFLNNILRFTTDYFQTTFDKGAAQGDRPNEKVVISRLQIWF